MPLIFLDDLRLNARLDGPASSPPLVLLHGLGMDLTIWDSLLPVLPPLRLLRCDMRGHGGSDTPPGPYAMGALIRDAERLMDHFGLKDAVVLGHAVGGMIAQGLAVKRRDLVRALVLSNTAARIGSASQWQTRIDAVRAQGMSAIAPRTLDHWFGRNPTGRPDLGPWRDRLLRQSPEGWIGVAAALKGADFYTTTATLRLPTLAIAGDRDGDTPPDLVRETADLVPGSRFVLLNGAGHLPFVEKPADYGATLTRFLKEIGHV